MFKTKKLCFFTIGIRTKSPAEKVAAAHYLAAKTGKQIANLFSPESHRTPVIGYYTNDEICEWTDRGKNDYSWEGTQLRRVYDFSDLVHLENKIKQHNDSLIKVEVKLNSSYTAVIDLEQNLVKVGCQAFTFESIENLYNQLQKAKS